MEANRWPIRRTRPEMAPDKGCSITLADPGAAIMPKINHTTIWEYRDESVILKSRKTGYESNMTDKTKLIGIWVKIRNQTTQVISHDKRAYRPPVAFDLFNTFLYDYVVLPLPLLQDIRTNENVVINLAVAS